MKVIIEMDVVDDDYIDEDHEMGVTEEGFEYILNALSGVGDNIQIRKEA